MKFANSVQFSSVQFSFISAPPHVGPMFLIDCFVTVFLLHSKLFSNSFQIFGPMYLIDCFVTVFLHDIGMI